MGTNFYWTDGETINRHIGKRSAAGLFCWDCGLSLCAAGHDDVHYHKARRLNECAVCGLMPKDESIKDSTTGRELGFNKSKPRKKAGVCTCCSFSFAMSPGSFADYKTATNLWIEDEYGNKYTLLEFGNVLSECPIKYFQTIGQEFS